MTDQLKICIIGGGNLGSAIARGLVKAKWTKPANITVTKRQVHKIKDLEKLNIRTTSDNKRAVAEADIILLAVKPYQMAGVAEGIKTSLESSKPILISVVTGISLVELERLFGSLPIFRAMPNTAVALGKSITCLSTSETTQTQQDLVCSLFDTVGKSILIQDDLMDAATVLGACGIAFAMRFIRAASQGGIQIGFDAQTAQTIAAQVVKGAAALLTQENAHPESEIDRVTTPKGCTIVGLNEMEFQGFSAALIRGISKSHAQITDISKC